MKKCANCRTALSATPETGKCPKCGYEPERFFEWPSLLSTVIAGIAGFGIWGLVFALSNGNPLGAVDTSTRIIFFAPIVGTLVPLALRALAKGRADTAAWIAALAPFLGIVNAMVVTLIATVIEGLAGRQSGHLPSTAAITVTSILWMIPLARFALLPIYRDWKDARASAP